MSSRLVKTIRAKQVTSVEIADGGYQLTAVERRSLIELGERKRPELNLRRAGLTPDEVSKLQFLKWSLQGRLRSPSAP